MNGIVERKKRVLPSEQKKYIYDIKLRLSRKLQTSRLSTSQLADILEETYHFNINKSTLANLFDTKNERIDFACLVTVCKYFDIEFSDILALSPAEGENGHFSNNGSDVIESSAASIYADFGKELLRNFPALNDRGYEGLFSGFILPPTPTGEGINDFDLELYRDGGEMRAHLIRKARYYSAKFGKDKVEPFSFHGIPFFSQAYGLVLIFLTDDAGAGEFYFLAFGYDKYRAEEGLVFRQGLSVTGEAIGRSKVVSQNFLLFNKPLADDKFKYVPGLLKKPNGDFCVSVKSAEALAKEHKEVKIFLEELLKVLELNRMEMYVLNEDNILSDKTSCLSKYDRLKALLLLKEKSTVAEKCYFLADSKFSGFAKNFLLREDALDSKTAEPG